MTLEYLVFADLILFTRLFYLVKDGPLSKWQIIGLGVTQIILLSALFQGGMALVGVALTVALVTALALLLRSRLDPAKGYRLVSLLVLLLLPWYIGSFGQGFIFRPEYLAVAEHLAAHLPPLIHLDASSAFGVCGVVLGMLLLANETNIGIRAAFHHLKLEPTNGQGAGNIDQKEYNAGRVIGILERWLMFLVVVATNDLSALAFIVAAKGLARMKQLENKQFAEYMLVGTLLSAVAAVLIGLWIKPLLMAM